MELRFVLPVLLVWFVEVELYRVAAINLSTLKCHLLVLLCTYLFIYLFIHFLFYVSLFTLC